MNPYFEEKGITIYHGDCRDVLPSIAVADLVVADPPYLFGLASVEGKVGWGDLMNSAYWYAAWLSELKRITANSQGAAWVFNSWRSFPVLAKAAYDARWAIESLLVWDKDWIGPGGTRGLRPQYELVALFIQSDFAIANRSLPDVWRQKWMTTIGVTDHRAEKPEALIEKIIKESGGNTILDPFMGSGTTLVAAKNLGRNAVGIEVEERHCETAAKRLSQEVLSFVKTVESGESEKGLEASYQNNKSAEFYKSEELNFEAVA